MGEGQRERGTQNLKQVPGSELSAQSPMRGSNHKLWGLGPRRGQTRNWLSHPSAPNYSPFKKASTLLLVLIGTECLPWATELPWDLSWNYELSFALVNSSKCRASQRLLYQCPFVVPDGWLFSDPQTNPFRIVISPVSTTIVIVKACYRSFILYHSPWFCFPNQSQTGITDYYIHDRVYFYNSSAWQI